MLDRSVSFRSLLAPVTPEQFFEKHFDQKPLHISGDEDKFADIFSWQDLNQITNMTSVWAANTMRLVLDTDVIDPKHYCSKGPNRDLMNVMKPDFHKVAAFMEQGASLNLANVEMLHDGIASVSRALQTVFSALVECHVMSSRKQRKAFSSHFDLGDVFALHIAGEKVWRIYENRFDKPADAEGYRPPNQTPTRASRRANINRRSIAKLSGD